MENEMEKPSKPNPKETISFNQNQCPSYSTTSVQDSRKRAKFYFPDEMIYEILLRLPVKFLLRFKCVSKSWLSLISSPHFIKAHLKLNSSLDKNHCLLMWTACNRSSSLKHCSINSLLDGQENPDVVNLDFPNRDKNDNSEPISYVGCCNGLILIAIDEKDLFLWNPFTRKSKKLPDLGLQLDKFNNHDYSIAYGFGYDEFTDDYKVAVIIGDLEYLNDYDYKPEVKIYSIKTESWKRIGDFYGFVLWNCGVFINGKLHWLLNRMICRHIFSLDLATETYGVMKAPRCEDYCLTKLVTFGRNLCLIRNDVGVRSEVWVMNEYGVGDSWMKVFNVPLETADKYLLEALRMSTNAEFLGLFNLELRFYNSKDNSFREIKNFVDDKILSASYFVESLALPSVADADQSPLEHQGQRRYTWLCSRISFLTIFLIQVI